MVAIVAGNGLGLSLGSLGGLGSRGGFGDATLGRAGALAYVNAATGNLILQNQDELLAGHGLSASSLRTYNSQGQLNDDNADNWTLGLYARQIQVLGTVNTAGSTIQRIGRDGAVQVFSFNTGTGTYLSTAGAGAHDVIEYVAGTGELVWTEGSTRLRERYDAQGRLIATSDTAGNALQYTYGANGLVALVSHGNGSQKTYYDYSGNLLTQIRTVGQDGSSETRVRYGYDASNRLSTVTVDLTPQDGSIADGKVYQTTYTYDGASTRVASVAQSDGTSLAITYKLVGADYRVETLTDALGAVTRFAYDTANRRTTVTDARQQNTVYTYDAQGQLLQVDAPAVNGTVASTGFQYNANGDVIRVTDGEGRWVATDYDGWGNATKQTDSAGNVVIRAYNGSRQLIAESVAGDGSTTSASTRFVYAQSNPTQLRFQISPEGRVTEYRYNGFGERTATIQYAAGAYAVTGLVYDAVPSEATMATWVAGRDLTRTQRQDFEYDGLGQLSKTIEYGKVDAQGVGIADDTRSVTQYVYDRHGKLVTTIDPRNGTTTYTYDGLGRVLTTKDAAQRLSTSIYDDANRKVQVSAFNGLITTSSYDRAGRLVSVLEGSAQTANLGETTYAYDARNQLLMSRDATGNRHWYVYDAAGRRVGEVDAIGTLTEYRLDRNGQATSTIRYGTLINTALLVDASGNPVTVAIDTLRPATTAKDQRGWRVYDQVNRLVKEVSALGEVVEYGYDRSSRVVMTRRYATLVNVSTLGDKPTAASVAPAQSANDGWTRTFYDADGRVAATLDAVGTMVESQYDDAGRLVATVRRINRSQGAIATGTLAQIRPAPAAGDTTTRYFYDAQGRLVATLDALNYLTEKVYDANDNVVRELRYATKSPAATSASTVASLRAGSVLQDSSWSYDAVNRVLTQTTDPSGLKLITSYQYDDANRRLDVTDPAGTVTRTVYDVQGNSRSVTVDQGRLGLTTSSTYDAEGRVLTTTDAAGTVTQFGYDALGRKTVQWVDPAGLNITTVYVYDAQGNLARVIDPNGKQTRYLYDAQGRLRYTLDAEYGLVENLYDELGRVSETVRYAARQTGIQTFDVGQGLISNGFVWVNSSAADVRTRYTYDALGRKVVERLDPEGVNSVTVFNYDAQGNLARVIDPNGKTTRYLYDALGRLQYTLDAEYGLKENVYDAAGHVAATIEYLARQGGIQTFDVGQGLISNSFVSITSSPTDKVTRYAYDAAGREIYRVDGVGDVTETTYDKAGRVVSSRQYATPIALPTQGSDDGKTVVFKGDYAQLWAAPASIDPNKTYKVRVKLRQLSGQGYIYGGVIPFDASGQPFSSNGAYHYAAVGEYMLTPEQGWKTFEATLSGVNAPGVYGGGKFFNGTVAASALLIYNYAGNENSTDLGRLVEVDTLELIDMSTGQVVSGGKMENGAAGWSMDRSVSGAYAGVATALDAAQIRERLRPGSSDRTTRFAYDSAGREIYRVDAAGAVTETSYDAASRVVSQRQYATPIALPADGSLDGKTVVFKGDYAQLWAPPASIDPNKSYTVRVRLRQLSGQGYIYGGVIPFDASGQAFSSNGAYHYAAVGEYMLTPEQGWKTFEATLSGVNAPGVYGGGKFFNGTVAASALLIYNYAGNENSTDLGRLVEVDTLELIDMSTGQVVSGGKMENGAAGWLMDRSVSGAYAGVATTLDAAQIRERLRPAAGDRTTRYAYDAAGRQTYGVDASGAVTQYEYDAAGRVTATRQLANTVPTGNALKVWTRPGTNSSVSKYLGTFKGGDVVTASVRFKAPAGWVGQLFLGDAGGAVGYENSQVLNLVGNGAWQTLTITQTMSHDDPMWVYLYGNVGSADSAGFVLYDNVTVRSDQQGVVLQDAMDSVSYTTSDYQSRTQWYLSGEAQQVRVSIGDAGSDAQLQALFQSMADPLRDRVTRSAYDAVGREVYRMDAAGAVTQYEYDAAGRVTATRQLANTVPTGNALKVWTRPGTNSSVSKYLGTFKGGDVVTASVRFKAPAGWVGQLFLGDAGGAVGYENSQVLNLVGNGAWQTLTITQSMSHDDPMWVYLYGNVGSADTAGFVLYDNVTVRSDQQGVVLQDAMDGVSYTTSDYQSRTQWYLSDEAQQVRVTFEDAGNADQLKALFQSMADPARDRVTRFAYDAAGREVYRLDAAGAVTETIYDAAGRVVSQRQYATPIALPADGSVDGKTVVFKGDNAQLWGQPARIDPNKTYKIRVRLRQLSGQGYIYGGVIPFDASGQPFSSNGAYHYAAVGEYMLTPDQGWKTFEATLSGVNAPGVYGGGKFFNGTVSASALLIYNYGGGGTTDLGRLVEVDTLELIDLSTGQVVSGGKMENGAANWQMDRSVSGAYAGVATALDAAQIRERLRPAGNDRTTRFVYDAAGRPVYTIDAIGGVTRQRFNAEGVVVETIRYGRRYGGAADVASLDAFYGNAANQTVVDRSTRFVLDELGRTRFTVDALGNVVETIYNGFGEVARTRAFGSPIEPTWIVDSTPLVALEDLTRADVPNARETVHAYDADGRLRYTAVSHRIENGQKKFSVTERKYDAFDQTVGTTSFDTLLTLQDQPRVVSSGDLESLVTRVAAKDRSRQMSYDAAGRLLTSVDGEGYVETFEYDGLGNKTRYTNQAQAVFSYAYDMMGRLILETSPKLNLSTVNEAHQFSNDPANLTSVLTRLGYNAFGQLTSRTEAEGRPEQRTTRYEYDAMGRQTVVRYEAVGVYDVTQDDSASNGANGTVVRTETLTGTYSQTVYDVFGQAVINRDVGGAFGYKTYDKIGRLVYEIDGNRALTTHSYSAIDGESSGFTRLNGKVDLVDSLDVRVSLTAIGDAMASFVSLGDPRSSLSFFDRLGRIVVTYDKISSTNLTRTQLGAADIVGAAYSFDLYTISAGRQAGQVDYTYNAYGEVTQRAEVLDRLQYRRALTRYVYDQQGQVVREVNAEGYVTQHERNAFGEEVKATQYARAIDPAGDVNVAPASSRAIDGGDPAGGYDRVLVTAYDRRGVKASETQQGTQIGIRWGDRSLARQVVDVVTTFDSDKLGRQTRSSKVVIANGAQVGFAETTSTFYDVLGRTSFTIDEAGRTVMYDRDAYGNAVRITRLGSRSADGSLPGPSSIDQTMLQAYDKLSRLTWTRDATGAETFLSRNARGDVVKQWQPFTEWSLQNLAPTSWASLNVVRNAVQYFGYDKVGRQTATVTLMQRAAGDPLTYTKEEVLYNSFGEIESRLRDGAVTEKNAYDVGGRMWKSTVNGVTTLYWYDLQGNVSSSFKSDTVDLSTLSTVGDTPTGLRRATTIYDRLGRSISQTMSAVTHDEGRAATQLVTTQTLDAWGNVLSVTRNGVLRQTYRYDAGNQAIATYTHNVTSVNANGVASTAAILSQAFFDASGRQVGAIDGNGVYTSWVFNNAGLLDAEYRGDRSVESYWYDGLGRMTNRFDAVGRNYAYGYDNADREINRTVSVSGGPTRQLGRVRYDELGRKISETSGEETSIANQTTLYWYDGRGNLTMSAKPQGQRSEYKYDGAGHKIYETDANGFTSSWGYNAAGQLIAHVDLGAANYSYTYDLAGQLKTQTNSRGQNLAYQYTESGLLRQVTDGYRGSSTRYDYDAEGNRTRETFKEGGLTYRDVTSTYDTQGRLATAQDATGPNAGLAYSFTVSYDAVGNRRRVQGTQGYRSLNTDTGVSDTTPRAFDQWFTYDEMNRVVINEGVLTSGVISEVGAKNVFYYDGEGRRRQSLTKTGGTSPGGTRLDYEFDFADRLTKESTRKLTYANGFYTAGDAVVKHKIDYSSGSQVDYAWDTLFSGEQFKLTTSTTTFDTNGRAVKRKDFVEGIASSQTTAAAAQSWSDQTLWYDTVGNLMRVDATAYAFKGTTGGTTQVRQTYKNSVTTTDYSYYLQEGYLERGQALSGQVWGENSSTPTQMVPSESIQSYDVNGNLLQLQRGTSYRWYVSDNSGHIVTSWATTGSALSGSNQDGVMRKWTPINGALAGTAGSFAAMPATPTVSLTKDLYREKQLYLNDRRVGMISESRRNIAGKGGRDPYRIETSVADMDVSGLRYDTSLKEGSTITYTVQAGETLQSLAMRFYGDEALWYRIAEANTLDDSTVELKPGQSINIPQVTRSLNSSSSGAVYNADKLIGDTSAPVVMPPPPPVKEPCGGMGMIIVIVVAIVVTYFTYGAASSALGSQIAGGAVAGAAGAAAGQVVGMAIGVQDSFSWKQVGMGAIGGAVMGGMSQFEVLAGNTPGMIAARAAVSNAVTQGIGVVTGLQDGFNWKSVAISAIAAPIADKLAKSFGDVAKDWKIPDDAMKVGQGLVRGMVSQTVRIAVMGGGKVDYAQVVGDAFGTAIGESIAAESRPKLTFAQHTAARKAALDPYGIGQMSPQPVQVEEGAVTSPVRMPGDIEVTPLPAQIEVPRTVRAGDFGGSLERIARSELGAGAGQRAINNYVGQLFELNGISNARRIMADQSITLPGSDTAAATAGLKLYGSDVAIGEAIKAKAAQASLLAADGMRTGPTIERAQALGIYSGSGDVSFAAAGGYSEIRGLSGAESFFTFNQVGRFMNGWAHAALDIVKSPYTLAKETLFTVGDVVGNATYSAGNWLLGGSQSYQNDSALFRSVETNGVLGTVGLVTKGAVLSLPGIAQVNAINRGDWYALGESGPGTYLAATSFNAVNLASERTLLGGTLNEAATARATELMSLSRAQRGPVLSAVMDPRSGEIFYGQNLGRVPTDLHPLLQQRLDQYLDFSDLTGGATPLRAGVPGSHSEIVALDQALKAREFSTGVSMSANGLSEFLMTNRSLIGTRSVIGIPPRCLNCVALTNGVTMLGGR